MFSKLVVLFTAVVAVLGAPAPTPATITDTDVLQFALTLEHLENAFYSGALAKYNEQAFANAGQPSWVRGRFEQIASHEAEHVTFLTTALGANATKPCQYKFPDTDPKSFMALAMVLETVGGSAYLGAAQFVSDKSILTAAASILAVESRHSSWVTSAAMKLQPWNGAFDTPLLPSGVFSLAAQFITDCPASNPPLPVQPFPELTLSNTNPQHGAQVTATVNGGFDPSKSFMVWISGLNTVFTTFDSNMKTTVPQGLEGTVYAAVVSSKNAVSDQTLRSGFFVVQFPFSSTASQ